MKTVLKKFICLILIVSMIFSISSCAVKEDYKVAFELLLDLNYIELIKHLPNILKEIIPKITFEKVVFTFFGYSDLLLDENWIMGKTMEAVKHRYGGEDGTPGDQLVFPLGEHFLRYPSNYEPYDCYVVYFRDGEAYLIEKCREDAYYDWTYDYKGG